jgi:hypothetical protein
VLGCVLGYIGGVVVTLDEARKVVARAWCSDSTASKEMDAELAEQMAGILAGELDLQEQRFLTALNAACTCGGNNPNNGCPACETFHNFMMGVTP